MPKRTWCREGTWCIAWDVTATFLVAVTFSL